MKILFIRHAESIDDLTDQYGGWLDLPLTPHGKGQVQQVISVIQELNIDFQEIYHSPLLRATQSAQIVASGLRLPTKEFLWFKEKNGYGLLTGITKSEAKEKYPDLIKDLDGGYIYGSEPEDKFIERVKIGYDKLVQSERDIIVVTHGGILTRLLNHILGYTYTKAHDAGFVLWDTETQKITAWHEFDYSEVSV